MNRSVSIKHLLNTGAAILYAPVYFNTEIILDSKILKIPIHSVAVIYFEDKEILLDKFNIQLEQNYFESKYKLRGQYMCKINILFSEAKTKFNFSDYKKEVYFLLQEKNLIAIGKGFITAISQEKKINLIINDEIAVHKSYEND